jgi:uncharacterized repeat protein (TIGR03803 family)
VARDAAGVTETVLYSFAGSTADGDLPYSGLIQGSDGNFYGTTFGGGKDYCGTVYKITPSGIETVLYSFGVSSSKDGCEPAGGLFQGGNGTFYGTTSFGGASGALQGGGTAFTLTSSGIESAWYSFTGGAGKSVDGQLPMSSLIQGSDGNFYGTAANGGTTGFGTVFKLTPTGAETVFYTFDSGAGGDGELPMGSLIQASDGNFYGTTVDGGAYGAGTVFQLTPSGTETVIYSFGNTGDGQNPRAGLIQASDGNFYGTTVNGGASGLGTVFQVTPSGAETMLYSFAGGSDGAYPVAALTQGSDGNLYGTTLSGGASSMGTIFMITTAGVETVLHSFTGGGDGESPAAGLIQGSDGSFYGTTESGGTSIAGTVFKLTVTE